MQNSALGINMHPIRQFSTLPKPLVILVVTYFLTSLGHFAHNAEYLCEYPNLPTWLTRAKVYAAWLAITSVGLVGLILIKNKLIPTGLLLVATYAALGFDGLGHYAVAPMAHHTLVANITILSEVAAAALLLPAAVYRIVFIYRKTTPKEIKTASCDR
jgi:hypothetical protein